MPETLKSIRHQIMTPQEIATEFGIADAVVRHAIQHGYLVEGVDYVKLDGRTNLIYRPSAEARWGKK